MVVLDIQVLNWIKRALVLEVEAFGTWDAPV